MGVGLVATHGFSFERDAVGVVDDPVEDGIGQGGVSDGPVPVLERELTCDKGSASAGPIFQDLEQVVTLPLGKRGESVVVEDQEIGLLQSVHERGIGPVAASESEGIEQSSEPEVPTGEALPARGLGQGTRQEGLPRSGGPVDQDDLMPADPVAAREAEHDGTIEASGGVKVEVLDAGGEPEFGLTQEPGEAAVFPHGGFPFDEKGETVLEGKALHIRDALLLLKGGGHARQPEFPEAGEGGFGEHDQVFVP